jgi:hypothetical protein
MKKIIYSVLLIAPVFFAHCKKDTVAEPTRLDLLTGHKWKIDKLLYSVKGDPTILVYTNAVYKTCELDDVYEFRKDNGFSRADGLNLCGSVALYPPYGNTNWSADASLTDLTVELFATYSRRFKVINLTASELRLDWSTIDYLQQEVLYTYYFKRAD